MEKNTNAVKKPVQLPEGHMCATCGGCIHLNRSDKNSDGKIWCGEHHRYVSGGESACSDYIPF